MKSHFAITIILFASVQFLWAQNDPNCGIGGPQVNSMTNGNLGVINGVNAAPHEFPWQASMQWSDFGSHQCGCSILNKRWLVTAAHCGKIFENFSDRLRIVLGTWNIARFEKTTVVVNVSKIIVNPSYNENTINNDVALLKMDRDLDLHNSKNHLGSICLPEQNEPMDKFEGKGCTTTGWGYVTYNGTGNFSQTSDILKKVNLTIWRQSFCKEAYSGFPVKIYNEMICASDYEKGSCKGDSGGPLVNYVDDRWVLQGIVSWSDQCGVIPYRPSVYTRVSKFVDWIWKTVKDN